MIGFTEVIALVTLAIGALSERKQWFAVSAVCALIVLFNTP